MLRGTPFYNFFAKPQNYIYRLNNLKNRLLKLATHIFLYKFRLVNFFQERKIVKKLFNVSKNDKNHYVNIVALLCCVTICRQRKVSPKNITEKEKFLLVI